MKRLTKTAGLFGILAGILTAGVAVIGAIADRKDFNEETDAQTAANNSGKEEPVNIVCEGLTTEPITNADTAPAEEEQ